MKITPTIRTFLILFLADFAATSLWKLTHVQARWITFIAASVGLFVLLSEEKEEEAAKQIIY